MHPDTSNLDYAPTSPDAAAVSPSYKWWVVAMLWCICFLNYGDRQAIPAVFTKLQSEFNLSDTQLGTIGSAFMWIYAFGSPFAGYIADRVRRKDLILGGCFFWSIVTATTAWCATFQQFVFVRAMEGLGETFYFPASMSLISDYHGKTTRSKALAFHQSSVYIGTIAGSWIAALLAEKYNWRLGFYLFGGCGVVLVLILSLIVREPKRGQSESAFIAAAPPAEAMSVGQLLTILFAKPTAILLMLAFLGANFVATIFMIWTPLFLTDKFHFKLSTAGLSGAAFINIASAISTPIAGVLADRLIRRLAGGRMIIQASGLIFGAAFIYLIGSTHSVSTLLTAMVFFGVGKGFYDSNIFASLYDVIPPTARSTAAGVMNTVGWGGGALGPLAIGYFAQHGAGSKMDNMSHAIASTFVIYIFSAVMLVLAAIFCTFDRIDDSGAKLAALAVDP